jgi:hypothetical protein
MTKPNSIWIQLTRDWTKLTRDEACAFMVALDMKMESVLNIVSDLGSQEFLAYHRYRTWFMEKYNEQISN